MGCTWSLAGRIDGDEGSFNDEDTVRVAWEDAERRSDGVERETGLRVLAMVDSMEDGRKRRDHVAVSQSKSLCFLALAPSLVSTRASADGSSL